jgi:hypothetical protein
MKRHKWDINRPVAFTHPFSQDEKIYKRLKIEDGEFSWNILSPDVSPSDGDYY